MTRRYYLPDLPSHGGIVSLTDAEFQHAVRVMRVQVGEEIEIFDGQGCVATATITEITRRECHCKTAAKTPVDREGTRKLHLGIALPKPDRARELIERLVEIGVAQVTPVIAERTQRPPSPSLIEKLRRGVIEASKQCERNVLMTVADPVKFEGFISQCVDREEANDRWIVHPSGDPISQQVDRCGTQLVALVGPEGGWTDGEVATATERDFQTVGLGKRIFRIETAAAYVAARLID